MNPNFDALLTTTLNNHRATLENTFTTARPLVNWLFANDRMRKVNGGAKIVEPIMYAKNTTAGSYSGYDVLATTAQEGITAAEFVWKQYAASISISGIEEAKNSGEAAVINLLESKIEQTEESLHENYDVMLLGDGTGNAGKDWDGLAKVVALTDGVVGGINSTTETWWRPTRFTTAGVRSDDTWTTVFNTASKGTIRPNFGLTTQALYEHYEASLAPALRLSSNKEADARFEHLLFKACPLYFDANVGTGLTYFLNSKHIKLVGHSNVWFKHTPFQRPTNQDARFAQILLYGNLTVNNRSRHGVISAQTV